MGILDETVLVAADIGERVHKGFAFVVIADHEKGLERKGLEPLRQPRIGGRLAQFAEIAGHHAKIRIAMPARDVVEAALQAGLRRNDDFNGAEQEGTGLYQVTQKRGKRCSTAVAYLKPAMKRPNLTVETGAYATRVLLDGLRAAGVAYVQDGEPREAQAAREVILSGGAINSPHLLMLSGIGPAEHLREHGIDVVCDLPGVGQNLQDHLIIGVTYRCTQPVTLAAAESVGTATVRVSNLSSP